jgi:CheY-like chemotaxis protein
MEKPAPLILVIEDSPSVLETIVKTLQLSGFRTRQAPDALQAVRAARKERPDLILADVGLPGMDGATATSLLKDDPDFQDVPVILISAMSPEELGQRRSETGAVAILSKPFSPGDLVRAVRRAVTK